MQNFMCEQMRRQHAYSDFDLDEVTQQLAWDEYNKAGQITFLETKLNKKFYQFPIIDFQQSLKPITQDLTEKTDKDDPVETLTKTVKKEYLKIMAQIMSSNEVSMKQEISVFKKYLKVTDQLLTRNS